MCSLFPGRITLSFFPHIGEFKLTCQPANGIVIRPFEGDTSDTVGAFRSSHNCISYMPIIPRLERQGTRRSAGVLEGISEPHNMTEYDLSMCNMYLTEVACGTPGGRPEARLPHAAPPTCGSAAAALHTTACCCTLDSWASENAPPPPKKKKRLLFRPCCGNL